MKPSPYSDLRRRYCHSRYLLRGPATLLAILVLLAFAALIDSMSQDEDDRPPVVRRMPWSGDAQ